MLCHVSTLKNLRMTEEISWTLCLENLLSYFQTVWAVTLHEVLPMYPHAPWAPWKIFQMKLQLTIRCRISDEHTLGFAFSWWGGLVVVEVTLYVSSELPCLSINMVFQTHMEVNEVCYSDNVKLLDFTFGIRVLHIHKYTFNSNVIENVATSITSLILYGPCIILHYICNPTRYTVFYD